MVDGQARPRVDRHKLRVYLDDHLAGAVAGVRRMRSTARRLEGTPAGALLEQVADEVQEEREELEALLDRLDLRRSLVKEVATRLGELGSRVKSDGPLSPKGSMNTLLEVELLRSAVMGKRGLWQTLAEVAEDIGVDRTRAVHLADRSERQVATIDDVHAFVRRRALLSPPPRQGR